MYTENTSDIKNTTFAILQCTGRMDIKEGMLDKTLMLRKRKKENITSVNVKNNYVVEVLESRT